MTDLDKLQAKIIAFRDERNWAQYHNPKDAAISLSLEASELLEHFQWQNGDDIAKYIAKNKEDISDELADVLYWVLLMAHDLKINLEQAVSSKLVKNAKKYPAPDK